ncbi:hypothetical protein FRB98_005444, partial [Tulasnella sp. 332]
MTAPLFHQSGSGSAFGLGIGAMSFQGVMGFGDWATLKSAPNNFYVLGADDGAGGIVMYFSINNTPVGLVTAAGEGLDGFVGVDGTFAW